MPSDSTLSPSIPEASLPLERDLFLRSLLRELSGTLQEVVGLREAEGFVSVVGQSIGTQILEQYTGALRVEHLSPNQLSAVLVDLKRRIHGDFYVIEEDDTKIVLGNRVCPFGDKVKDRPSLCMMTSNVFGVISAETTGFAKVSLEETIANGHHGCRVVVYLEPSAESDAAEGRTYYRKPA